MSNQDSNMGLLNFRFPLCLSPSVLFAFAQFRACFVGASLGSAFTGWKGTDWHMAHAGQPTDMQGQKKTFCQHLSSLHNPHPHNMNKKIGMPAQLSCLMSLGKLSFIKGL